MADKDSLETRVAIVERDVDRMSIMFEKLDTAIDRISDVSSDMKNMLMLHEDRLNRQEKTNDEIFDELKEMRNESNKQHNELSSKITTVEKWRWMVMGAIALGAFAISHML